MQEVFDFLKKAGTYYLATVEGDQPRVRPFGTVNIFEGKLYIQTGKVKPCSKQMAANPKIEICAFNGQQWLRVAATAVNDDNVAAKADMLDKDGSLPGIKPALMADAVGTTRQTITSIEVGKYTASLPLAYKIAKFFGLTIEEVFDFSTLED